MLYVETVFPDMLICDMNAVWRRKGGFLKARTTFNIVFSGVASKHDTLYSSSFNTLFQGQFFMYIIQKYTIEGSTQKPEINGIFYCLTGICLRCLCMCNCICACNQNDMSIYSHDRYITYFFPPGHSLLSVPGCLLWWT